MARLLFACFLTVFVIPIHELAACGPFSIESSYLFVPANPGAEVCNPTDDTWDSDYNYSYAHVVSSGTPGTCFDSADANILSWVKFAGGAVSAADVRKILYTQSQKPGDAANTFGRFLAGSTPASREAMGYVQFAFKVEKMASLIREDATSWNEDGKKKATPAQIKTLLDAGIKARASATQAEIKQRYSYQIMKLKFYLADFRGVISEYESSGLAQAIAPVQWRARRTLAGALARTGKKEQAAAMLGEILVKSTDLSDSVHSDFHYILPLDEAKVTALATDPAARFGVRVLFGWQNASYNVDELRSAQKDGVSRPLVLWMFLRNVALFEENNGSALLGHSRQTAANVHRVTRIQRLYTSLLGYVNRILAGWIPAQIPSGGLPDPEKKQAIALADFASSMREGSPSNEQNVWVFYGAYMRYMGGQSDQTLKEIEKLKSAPYWKDKSRVLELLARIDRAPRIDAAIEKDVSTLRSVFLKGTEYRRAPLRDFLLLQLEKKYGATGEAERAVSARAARFLLSRGPDLDTFGDEKSLPLLVAFLEKKNKDPFERFLETFIQTKAEDVRDRLGSLHLLSGRFADAEREFSKLSPAYLSSVNKTYAGSLNPLGVDYADGNSPAKWDKRKVAQDLVRLEQKAAQNDAQANLQIASALYNMSHSGRLWILTRTYRSENDRYPHDKRLLENALARLKKAGELSRDRETLARIAYQKVLIQKGMVDLEQTGLSDNEDAIAGRRKALFAALDEFKGTQFYERYITSCSDYTDARKP